MKKIILSILSLSLLLTLFACDSFLGGGTTGTDDPEPTEGGESFTVTFDSCGGSEVPSQTVKSGETCIKPADPTRADCEFLYWWDGDVIWNFDFTKITSDTTLYAKWNPTNFNITYDLKGSTYTGTLPKTYNADTKPFTLGTPLKADSTFLGWLLNGEYVTELPFPGLRGDITLVADFSGPWAEAAGSESASVRTWDNGSDITVRLTDTAAPSASLTVKLNITKDWHSVKVTQGDSTRYITTYMDGEKRMLDFAMTPGDETAVITPVVLVGDETLESGYGTVLTNGIKIDTNYFPGFVRKAVTFTIDDGNIAMDNKFLSIMRPAGIVGTFNLISTGAQTAAEYLTMYKGYEIANHHGLHALPWLDGVNFDDIEIKDELYSSASDVNYMYKTNIDGLYYIDYKKINSASHSPYWHPIATDETYAEYAEITREELEAVFGEGSVVGFAYPHGKLSAAVKQYLIEAGYLYARKTGTIGDTTSFALPEDRFEWTYNANATNLNAVMEKFDKYADDGKLKFFSFGVHSADYSGQWNILETFAEKYGNREDDFYYATNRQIFEYEDAVKALVITEEGITNPSGVDVFVTINNVKTIIAANSTYNF